MNLEISNTYRAKKGYECFNACIVNSFAQVGVDLSSSDTFFSMDSNVLFENEQSILEVPSSVLFLDKYNIQYENDTYPNSDISELWKKIMADFFKSLVVRVRPEIMNYSKLFSSNLGAGHYINVINVDDKQVYFVDGYVPKITDDLYLGAVDKDIFEQSWCKERNKYRIIDTALNLSVEKIKRDARENFREYVNRSHDLLQFQETDNPEHPVLKMFWKLCERMQSEGQIDQSFAGYFFYELRVRGFLIVKNMIYEKLTELSLELAEEYNLNILKWNQTLMFMRKYMLQAKTDKFIALYGTINGLIREEDEILTRADVLFTDV